MANAVTVINAAHSNAVQLWYDDFTPDVEVIISNEDPVLCDKIMDYVIKLIKRSVLKNIVEGVNSRVHEDYKVSKILNAKVFYIGMGTKKFILNFVNKVCGLDLDPYTVNFKLTIDNESIIFIESFSLSNQDTAFHRGQVQANYCIRKYLISAGKILDHRKYANLFYQMMQ